MSYGVGMIWPLASEYCHKGWAVRRSGWDDETILGDTGRALRWVIYHSGLFHLLYRDAGTGERRTRVIINTDFAVEEFFAEDWTVLSPSCSYSGSGGSYDQQGRTRYPRTLTTPSTVDPLNPNAAFGTCPLVPPYADLSSP